MKTSGFRCETKFGLLFFLGHPNQQCLVNNKKCDNMIALFDTSIKSKSWNNNIWWTTTNVTAHYLIQDWIHMWAQLSKSATNILLHQISIESLQLKYKLHTHQNIETHMPKLEHFEVGVKTWNDKNWNILCCFKLQLPDDYVTMQ